MRRPLQLHPGLVVLAVLLAASGAAPAQAPGEVTDVLMDPSSTLSWSLTVVAAISN